MRGRGAKNTAGLYFGLAAQTPIRAHQKDGTSNCLRKKDPILSNAMPNGSHCFAQDPFSNPVNLRYFYVDFDGRDVYDFDQNRYVFFCAKLDDYRKFMKRRSPKWQTITLPADKFRQCAVQINELLL